VAASAQTKLLSIPAWAVCARPIVRYNPCSEVKVTVATVFIDLQVDFFSYERLRRNRQLLASNVNALATSARRYGSPIVWVKQIHAPDLHDASLEVRRGNHRIVIDGTDGAGLLPELHLSYSDAVLIKKRYSAFFRTDLDTILDRHACKTMIVAGINTHACIRATVVDAYQRDYVVWLARECIDSYDEEHHVISMKYMDGKLGVAMTNVELDTRLRNAYAISKAK
jgi:nicotinamidase-related amidase